MHRLKSLFRNSPWVMIAIAIHLIVIAGAAIFYTASHGGQKTDEAVTIRLAAPRPEMLEQLIPPETIDRKAIPKNEEAELVPLEQDVYIPTTETTEDLYLEHGDPNSLDDAPSDASTGGTAIGVGRAGHAGMRPSPFGSRRLGTGLGKGRGGATVGTEAAVLEGLRWLARHQNDDGSWGATTFATHCTTNPPCLPRDSELGTRFDAGMTALALLAFLGQGLSIDSKLQIVDTAMGTRKSAGTIVKKGIQWLIANQKPDGSFSSSDTVFEFPENDTLPTMAICEAYGLSKARLLKRPAQLAFDFLIAAQKRDKSGAVRTGWGPCSYADIVQRRDSGELDDSEFEKLNALVDPTVTCWVVMALQSAELCELRVPPDVLPAALAYVTAATASEVDPPRVDDGDKYVYHPARQRALAMLTRTFAGAPITDPYFERGSKELASDPPDFGKDGLSVDFYYWYFGTIALNQYDGPDSPRPGAGKSWSRWNKALVDAILPLQDKSTQKNVCSRGGWLQGTRGNRRGLELRNTALNIMTLEVYYRFENVFGAARRKQQ